MGSFERNNLYNGNCRASHMGLDCIGRRRGSCPIVTDQIVRVTPMGPSHGRIHLQEYEILALMVLDSQLGQILSIDSLKSPSITQTLILENTIRCNVRE